jgi:protein SCO1/2
MTYVLAAFFFVFSASAHEGHIHGGDAVQALPGESIYNLNSKWTSQDGKDIALKDLRGRPAVVAMAYTSCEHACPVIVEDMKKIERKLNALEGMKFSFLLFSFDSERDTPERLKAYAQKRKLDASHWQLLHGNPRAVREVAAALGIRFKKEKNGDFDHSNVIHLLDKDGVVRYQQIGLNQEPDGLVAKAKALQ